MYFLNLFCFARPQEPFTITPIFVHNPTTFHFTMEVTVDQSLLLEKSFPDFLPPQVSEAAAPCKRALRATMQQELCSHAPTHVVTPKSATC